MGWIGVFEVQWELYLLIHKANATLKFSVQNWSPKLIDLLQPLVPNDDYLLCLHAENWFLKDTFSFNYNFIFYDFKTSLKNTFIRKNDLKYEVINLFLTINIINDQSKLEKLKTNFEDKTSSIIKMLKSELISSASEDEINENTWWFYKAASIPVWTLWFKRVYERKLPQKRIIRFGRRH